MAEGAEGGGLRRKSEIETEFDKIVPLELKDGRIQPRRYSALSNYSQSTIGSGGKSAPLKQGKRISVLVVPKTSQNADPVDYVEKGFCCSPKCYRRFALGLFVAQIVGILLWVTTILMVRYYWPAPHFTGRFLPAYLTNASGKTRIIVSACLGSEPIVTVVLLGASLLLLKKGYRWIRMFYVINAWLSILLLIAGIHILIFAANVNEQNLEAKLKEELGKYDDNATAQGLLELATTKVDISSQEDWDDIQYYFGCCGIYSEHDWYNVRNFFDPIDIDKDPLYWRLPRSCCRSFVVKSVNIWKCMRHPEENLHLINQGRGCAQKLLDLLKTMGTLAGIQVFANWILQILTIWLMMSYYGILRYGDGTGYRRSWRTLLFEFFFIFLFREQRFKRKRTHKSEWLMPVNRVIDMRHTESRTTLGRT